MPDGLHNPLTWVRLIAQNVRRLIVLVLGFGFVGAGFAMLVLPGPGILVSIIGLAILAQEFAWAERTLDRTKSRASEATLRLTSNTFAKMTFALSASSLVVGGGVAAALTDNYRVVGASAVFAGVCGLIVLVPRVRAWLEASGPRNNGATNDNGNSGN